MLEQCSLQKIAKLLVTRLKLILPKLISPYHFAFIPGGWIAENEVILQKTHRVKDGMMAAKLDLQKPYDRVNGKFLKTAG